MPSTQDSAIRRAGRLAAWLAAAGAAGGLAGPDVAAAQRKAPRSEVTKQSVMIAPRAIVVDERHYQATFTVECTGTCDGEVRVPDGFDRLVIHRINCEVLSPGNGFERGSFSIRSGGNTEIELALAPGYTDVDTGLFVFNSFMNLWITAPDRGLFEIEMTDDDPADAFCTFNGWLRDVTSAPGAKGALERGSE